MTAKNNPYTHIFENPNLSTDEKLAEFATALGWQDEYATYQMEMVEYEMQVAAKEAEAEAARVQANELATTFGLQTDALTAAAKTAEAEELTPPYTEEEIAALDAASAAYYDAYAANYVATAAYTGSGSGTESDPYIITNRAELEAMEDDLTAYYQIANDIDLDGSPWTPIGLEEAPFTGTLDGNGHTISNADNSIFGVVGGATFTKLHVHSNIIGSITSLFVIVALTETTFDQCMVSGSILATGAVWIGGMVGSGETITTNCFSSVDISSTGCTVVGGLVSGAASSGWPKVYNSYMSGSVTGAARDMAGVIGSGFGGVAINCVATNTNIKDFPIYDTYPGRSVTLTNCYYVSGLSDQPPATAVPAATIATENFWKNNVGYDFDTIWYWDTVDQLPKLRAFLHGPTDVTASVAPTTGGVTTEIALTGTATDATAYQWQYSTDSGSTYTDITGATALTAAWTPGASGTYLVRFAASNADGTTYSDPVTVTIYDVPVISDETISSSTGPLTGSVALSATVDTAGSPDASYQWYCDDTPIDGAASPAYTHTFAGISAGDHTYHLVATTTGGTTRSADMTYTAYAAPVFTTVSISPQDGIPPYQATLTATATDANTIQWYNTVDQPAISPVTISDIGPASYYAVATGPGGTTRSEIVTTQGIDNPIVIVQPTTRFYLPGVSIPFEATGIDSASWSFGDGETADGLQTTHAYASPGDYTVTVTSGSYDVSFVVHIGNTPAQPAITGPTVGTSGEQISMSVIPEPGVVYVWNAGDGSTETEGSTLTHTYITGNTATYTITVMATNPYGSVFASGEISVAPPVTAEIIGGAEVYTTDQIVDLTAVATGDNPTYTWSGNGWTASGREITHDFGGYGDYTVTLTVDNEHGYTSSTTQIVHLGQGPGEIGLEVPPWGTFGQPVEMSAMNFGGEVDTWTWDLGDGTTESGPDITHVYTAGTQDVQQFTVRVTATNPYGSESFAAVIQLAKPFDAAILSPAEKSKNPIGVEIAFVAQTPTEPDLAAVVSYTWTMGDGSILHGDTVFHTYTTVGTYTATVTVDNRHGYIDTATVIFEVGQRPTLTVVTPKSGDTARIYREVAFSAMTDDGSPILWDFGDNTSAEGATVTHTYDVGTSGDVTVIASSTNTYGTTTTTLNLIILVTTWVWESALGKKILFDNEQFVMLRAGIDGMSGMTLDVVSSTAPQTIGELYQSVTYGRRTITFDILALGNNRAELELKRAEFLAAFNGYHGPGRLIWHREDGSVLYLNCMPTNGYPRFKDGTKPDAKQWPAEISIVAVDPCWYANDVITLAGDGTIINPGDMPCPALIILGPNGVSNITSGEEITPAKSAEGVSYDLSGIIVNTAAGTKSALDSEGNSVLYKIAISSKFIQIEPGENVISGAQSITIRPRWGGI